MGMESVYKLSVILNLVDNLSGQMNSVQSSVSGSVDKLNSAFGTMQKAGVAMAGIGGTITGLAMKTVTATFDTQNALIDGYVRCGDTDYWKEIMIKDDMMKLDRVTIKASFVDCEPQDVIRYVLACAGIEDYVLSDEHYGKKDLFVIDRKSGINTIAEVNSSWGIKNPFFFQKKVFYWGTKEEQKEIYVLEEGETILSLNKYGDLWEAETIAIPWIHHSQEVEVQHSKYSGIVTVEKTIVRSDDTGAVHMYIYFAGGEKDV